MENRGAFFVSRNSSAFPEFLVTDTARADGSRSDRLNLAVAFRPRTQKHPFAASAASESIAADAATSIFASDRGLKATAKFICPLRGQADRKGLRPLGVGKALLQTRARTAEAEDTRSLAE